MSRLFRRLSTLLLCSLLVLGVWLTQPLTVQAAEIRNLADDKLAEAAGKVDLNNCLLYTSPSPRDRTRSRMPSSA